MGNNLLLQRPSAGVDNFGGCQQLQETIDSHLESEMEANHCGPSLDQQFNVVVLCQLCGLGG